MRRYQMLIAYPSLRSAASVAARNRKRSYVEARLELKRLFVTDLERGPFSLLRLCLAAIFANASTIPEFVITASGQRFSAAFLSKSKSSWVIFTKFHAQENARHAGYSPYAFGGHGYTQAKASIYNSSLHDPHRWACGVRKSAHFGTAQWRMRLLRACA